MCVCVWLYYFDKFLRVNNWLFCLNENRPYNLFPQNLELNLFFFSSFQWLIDLKYSQFTFKIVWNCWNSDWNVAKCFELPSTRVWLLCDYSFPLHSRNQELDIYLFGSDLFFCVMKIYYQWIRHLTIRWTHLEFEIEVHHVLVHTN